MEAKVQANFPVIASDQPLLVEGLFFIPRYLEHYPYQKLFPNQKKIVVEYGSGNGSWILEKAEKNPETFFIAVEIRIERAKKIWKQAKKRNLTNLLIVWGDGKIFSRHYLKENEIDQIYVNFPDPWPKRRHMKHRLIEPSFAFSMAKSLKKGGEVICVTDHTLYQEEMVKTFLDEVSFAPKWEKPYYVHSLEGYGDSFFYELFRKKGKTIYFLCFVKQ